MNTDKAVTINTTERRPVIYCRRCGRELTHPDSYAAGIGPECSAKLGICQKELARLNMDMDPNLVAAAMDDGPSVVSLDLDGQRLILRFKFDEDGRVRQQVKAIAGWHFDFQNTKLWSVPATRTNYEAVMGFLPQARVYVKDLEKINNLGKAVPTTASKLPPRPKPAPRRAWMEDQTAYLAWDRKDPDFPAILQEAKECPGRRWNPDKFFWTAPPSQQLMELLDKWGFEVAQTLADYLDQFQPKEVGEIDLPEGLRLFPFQVDGLKFLESRRGRALIGDEMGLGKTIQALAWLRVHPEARPAVIIVPASLKLNWKREAQKWCPGEPVVVLSGRAGSDPQLLLELASHATKNRGNRAIIVVNYDILSSNGKAGWAEAIMSAMDVKAVVVDESHFIKNQKAQRTQAVKDLVSGVKTQKGKKIKMAEPVPHVIAMSGTPIINRPSEFYNTIQLVNPTVFPSWYKFATRYCDPKFNGFATEYTGASNTEELHHVLTNKKTGIMIRRLKKDVLKDLPAKIRSIVPLELENHQEYERAVEDFLGWLFEQEKDKARERLIEEQFVAEEKIEEIAARIGLVATERAANAETLVAISKLKQLASRGKLKAAISWIKDVVEQDEKIIIFAVHHWVIDQLMAEFGSQAVRLTGKESQEQRQEAVDRFQNDNSVQVFVGNIKAAGVGITLTAATHVAFLEMGWTPGEHQQAEDRAHRIGQDQVVNVYYLVAEGTIEEDIAEMLDRKADVLGQVLDGKKAKEESILGELLRKLKEKKDDQ